MKISCTAISRPTHVKISQLVNRMCSPQACYENTLIDELVTRKDYLELLQMKMNIFLHLLHNIYFALIYTILTIGILGTTRRL